MTGDQHGNTLSEQLNESENRSDDQQNAEILASIAWESLGDDYL